MPKLEKPASITVTLVNRKKNKSKSFVVYDTSLEEAEKLIKEALKK
ncbi:MAG TPA: hypothetical protein VJB05_01875 [archaeon]|nr:hypothetical protein [archaeon]